MITYASIYVLYTLSVHIDHACTAIHYFQKQNNKLLYSVN